MPATGDDNDNDTGSGVVYFYRTTLCIPPSTARFPTILKRAQGKAGMAGLKAHDIRPRRAHRRSEHSTPGAKNLHMRSQSVAANYSLSPKRHNAIKKSKASTVFVTRNSSYKLQATTCRFSGSSSPLPLIYISGTGFRSCFRLPRGSVKKSNQ